MCVYMSVIKFYNNNMQYCLGVVSKQKSEMAQNRKDMGQDKYHGGVWLIWGNGQTFVTSA